MNIFGEDFFVKFESGVRSFHSIFKYNQLKGELLEEIISKSLTDSNIEHKWECFSHNSSYDILVGDVEVSVKSGKVDTKNKLKISSFRTTKYKTIEDKVEFIDNNKSDIMFSCTFKDGTYSIYVFDTSVLKSAGREWISDAKGNHKSINSIVDISISKSMSDQVWYTIYLSKLGIEPVWKITI